MRCVCVSLLGILWHSCANVQMPDFMFLSLQICLPVSIPFSLPVTLFICLCLFPFRYLFGLHM